MIPEAVIASLRTTSSAAVCAAAFCLFGHRPHVDMHSLTFCQSYRAPQSSAQQLKVSESIHGWMSDA